MNNLQVVNQKTNSDLILLYNSKFVRKIQKNLSQILKNIDLNQIKESMILKNNNQKENLIIIVDFQEQIQNGSDFLQLKYFRDILESLNKDTNYKNIVNIISEIGVLGHEIQYFRALQYAAVINISQAYALKLGSSKIRINNICVPENIELSDNFTLCNLTKFLLSSDSINITGQTLSLSKELLR
ncbi:MAG: hypothetical protein CL764_04605 [Chloroflexi bacterium]|nr:hypothetical protein [Chloroflexota bacterium]|tara:strand:+ start:13377 stop:13931 length:555 start_codon:yes stop_codon:yes gene_type:complete